ncbi:FecR family protein [Tenacibaculum singaporense]|uniref:FecR family protein n=1 Tax=Tenacibaculum singaporense TaxID=2358479 RepID=UPI000F678650|nr:FecR family protein [Tenacibaculum singaporense]RSC95212.1 FecR family protein [Tenacibaculum singaporense]
MKKDDLIQKWLRNELTNEEQADFNTLDDANFLEEIIQEGQRFKADKHISTPSFESLNNRLSVKKTTSTNWLLVVSKIAAVFIIGLGIFYFLNNGQATVFNTQYAESKTITLPDNSMVELNEFSHLEYNSSTWKKQRSLLLKGEAFFDVEKGMRFDVKTSNGIISVLGTEFNVLDRDSIFKVSCYEGLVQVSYKNKITKLPVGKELSIIKGVEQNTSTILSQPKWLKNMSAFENVFLSDVVAELEQQYNIKVQLNIQNSDLKFTGAFTNNNLERALKSITLPFNLSYEINNKQRVIIWDEQQ